jgi:mannose/fructose/N-acetylgalactosamine-specific phosphotransferase system component IID
MMIDNKNTEGVAVMFYLLLSTLVISSLIGIALLLSRFGDSWGYTVARLTESESGLGLILTILEFSMPLLISLASMRLIYLLLNRKKRFVTLFYSVAVIAVLWPVVDLGFCWELMPEFMQTELGAHDAFIFWFLTYLALFGVWIPALQKFNTAGWENSVEQ